MGAASNSARVRARIALLQPSVDAVTTAFWGHSRVRELYPGLLLAWHPLMGAGVHLMEAAATLAAARGDALSEPLAAYYRHHAGEERGHDAWVVSDLVALGFPTSVVDRPAFPPALAVLEKQYEWLRDEHPVAFLGYLAAIEGHPPTPDEVDALQALTGLPAAAFSNYRKHALVDPRHAAELDTLIDSLPLTEDQVRLLEQSAMHTTRAIRAMFTAMLAEA